MCLRSAESAQALSETLIYAKARTKRQKDNKHKNREKREKFKM